MVLPLIDIIKTLFVAVGIPYFLLSSNSTLMQAWFLFNNHDRSPYPLYAISNVGCLVGLLSYPFVFEPISPVITQSYSWLIAYLVYVSFVGARAWLVQSTKIVDEDESGGFKDDEQEKPDVKR